MNSGKLPPQAIDLEESVLAALLLESDSYYDVSMWLIPEIFYKQQNQIICRAIISLKSANLGCDILTVTNWIKENKLHFDDYQHYITSLTSRLSSSAHIVEHIFIVWNAYVQREMIRTGNLLVSGGFETMGDGLALFDKAKKTINSIDDLLVRNTPMDMGKSIASVISNIEASMNSGNKLSGASTGFKDADSLCLGRRKKELVILGARPSMGKSAYALCEAWNLSQKNIVDFFSIEMSVNELIIRLASALSNVGHERIVTGQLSKDEFSQLITALARIENNKKLTINDTPSLSIRDFKSIARNAKRKRGIDFIYIDYLQLMTGEKDKSGTRDQEIGTISRGLKEIAKECDLGIIALSQLGRAVESRGDKKPELSDLRESGNIEQDADIVEFLYRPERYGFQDILIDGQNVSSTNMMEIIQAKFRGGRVGSCYVKFIKHCLQIVDYSPESTHIAPKQYDVPF